MARITVEDCLDQAKNRFILVHMTAKRVRQLIDGSEPLVNAPKNERTVVALREIAAGKIVIAPEEGEIEEADKAIDETPDDHAPDNDKADDEHAS